MNAKEHFKINFGKRLSSLIDNKNGISPLKKPVTRIELAKHIDSIDPPCSRQILYRYETGAATPDLHRLKIIAEFFQVSYDYLLGESEAIQRENIDIAAKTGLNDRAVNNLKKLKELTNARDRIAAILINYLLENQEELTETITRYLEKYLGYEYVMRTVHFIQKVEGKPFNEICKFVREEEEKDIIHKAVLEDCLENPKKNSNYINQCFPSTLSSIYELIKRGHSARSIEIEIREDFIKIEFLLTRALKKIVNEIAAKMFKSKSQIKLLNIKGDWISESWQKNMLEEGERNEEER